MSILSRWLAPIALAASFGVLGLTPAPAHAQSGDDLVRVIVDVADVIFRSGQPYYRNGNYGYNDRLIVVRDNRGHARYYRNMPRNYRFNAYRPVPPPAYRGNGYANNHNVKCNKHGKCQASTRYYDPRYDRDRNHRGPDRHDRRGPDRDDRRYSGRR